MASQSAFRMTFTAVFLLVLELVCIVGMETPRYYDYIVVGAGPGGLQIGHYLQSSNRDYVILERGAVSGNFFINYPRHDKLISINKRNTGKTNKEFNLRHDWNSLLSDDDRLLYKHFSQEFFPPRETMLHYLKNYTEYLNLNVQYNTNVSNIQPLEQGQGHDKHTDAPRFMLKDQHDNVYKCRTLIMATGLSAVNAPHFEGMELTESYEDVSVDPEEFEGQTVLILGRGNSAFEVADRIYGATNLIHMIGRSRVRLSWSTHYVGDLRAINNGLLDTYQLKSLDAVLEAPMEEVRIVKRSNKLFLDMALTSNTTMGEGEMYDNFAVREPYDRVIRCLGFTFDDSIFQNDTTVSRGIKRKSKYPLINPDYQSSDMEGLYYAGTVTHSLDYRKSSGGFLHGFRYTGRALHRLLEWRNHGNPWPHRTGPMYQLLPTILKRINEASGTYQMFGVLGDVIAIRNETQKFEIYEEFPIQLLHEFSEHTGRAVDSVIVIVLQYGADFSGPGKDVFHANRATGEPSEAHQSNFLHPVFYHYSRLPTFEEMQDKGSKQHLPRPDAIHHIVEDFLTTWDAPTSHILPLRRFIENVVQRDMRYYFAEDCHKMTLLYGAPPDHCQQYYLHGQGLYQTEVLHVVDMETYEEEEVQRPVITNA